MKPCKICGQPQSSGYIICGECAEKVERLTRERDEARAERDKAVKCISKSCAAIEFVEGGIAYCSATGSYCDDCEHVWRGTGKEGR